MGFRGSLSAYARHRKEAGLIGGNLQACQKARDTDRIQVGDDGLVDFAQADIDWERNTNHRRRRNPKQAQPKRLRPPRPKVEHASTPETPPPDDQLPDDGSFFEAQRQREWERVWKDRDDRRKRSRELLDRAGVITALGDLIVTAKTNLRGIGAKLAPDLAVESNAASCQSMVDLEIDAALEKISTWQPE